MTERTEKAAEADGLRVSRRQILAGVAGVGAFGASAGAYTAASLEDRELLPIGTTAGSAGIDVDCDAADCQAADGTLSFAIDDIEPGAAGDHRFTLSVTDNPVRVWARTDCPPATDALGSALEIRLWIEAGCNGAGRQLFPAAGDGSWGSLREFKVAFANGARIDDPSDPCFSSAEDACLRLDYRLSAGAAIDDGTDSEMGLELYAEQCRHVSETSAEAPFEPRECESPTCTDCVTLGKLEVQEDTLEEQQYELDEIAGPFDGDGHSYEVDVLGVTNKDDGTETVCVEFALLRDGVESLDMCGVTLKGATETWTSELDPPATRTSGELCTEKTEAGKSGNLHQPAISYVEISVCDDGTGSGGGEQ